MREAVLNSEAIVFDDEWLVCPGTTAQGLN